MDFQVNNNNYSRFYESNNNRFQGQQPTNINNPQISNDFFASLFALLSKVFASASNPAINHLNQLFQSLNPQPRVEDYGGFKFKNADEKARVDQALQELRAEQAANPGKKVSKKFKIGKYKFRVTLDENGDVNIKKKKKKKGLFGKIGGFFKKVGKGIGNAFKKVGSFVKKALPIVSTVAMFIPGLQPFAIAARVATGVMGVVDGIKNGNIFGAVTSAFSAMSGMGGKIGQFASNLTSKAKGFLGNMGSNFLSKLGNTGTWMKNTFNQGFDLFNKGKTWLSNFTTNMGTKVSDFIFSKGSPILNNLTKSFHGNFGNWLTQNGSDFLKSFANRMGTQATNWLNQKATNFMAKLMDNPITRKVSSFLNSPFGQILMSMLRGKRA